MSDFRESFERIARGARGPKGEQGKQGERGSAGLPWTVRWALVTLFVLSLAVGSTAYFAAIRYYHDGQAAQQHQGAVLEQRLCTSLARLAALKPPPGNPASNPSRAFDDNQHAVLAQLGPDVGCKEK